VENTGKIEQRSSSELDKIEDSTNSEEEVNKPHVDEIDGEIELKVTKTKGKKRKKNKTKLLDNRSKSIPNNYKEDMESDVKFDESYFGWMDEVQAVNTNKLERKDYISFEIEDLPLEDMRNNEHGRTEEQTAPENNELEIRDLQQEENETREISDSESEIETEEEEVQILESETRQLRPRTPAIKPTKYSAFTELEEGDYECNNSEDCMFYYGPYPGYRVV
jgi:hypothetical protein